MQIAKFTFQSWNLRPGAYTGLGKRGTGGIPGKLLTFYKLPPHEKPSLLLKYSHTLDVAAESRLSGIRTAQYISGQSRKSFSSLLF